MWRGWGKKWLEMQNVSLDAFAIFAGQDGVIVKKFHNIVWSFEFCCQLSVFVQEIVNTHKHLLIQQEIVNLGMFVKRTFLMSFLHFTVLNGSWPLFCQLGEPGCFVSKQMFGVQLSFWLKTCLVSRKPMHELEWSRTNG